MSFPRASRFVCAAELVTAAKFVAAAVLWSLAAAVGQTTAPASGPAPATGPAIRTFDAPHAQTIAVEMIGPVTKTTDLQIITILKHDPAGDKYIEAMDDLNRKLGRLLSNLRERGEFGGELGETLLFTPPANSIAARRVLLIGIGDESGLSLAKLHLAGAVAARESHRLGVANVSFAPALRDQGSSRLDAGESAAAFVDGWILAYDTEKRLQEQGLLPADASGGVSSLTMEAGEKYFDSVAARVSAAVKSAAITAAARDSTGRYVSDK